MNEMLARFRWFTPLAFILVLSLAPLTLTAAGLKWDALEKSYDAKECEEEAVIQNRNRFDLLVSRECKREWR